VFPEENAADTMPVESDGDTVAENDT